MIRILSEKYLQFSIPLLFLCVVCGCDKISSLSDYFSPKQKAQTTTPIVEKTAAAAPAGVTTPPKAVGNQPPAANVLAKVGSWTMTVEEFQERLQALKQVMPNYDVNDVQSNKMILEELIRQQMLVDDAEKSGLAKDKDINMAVEEFRRTLLVREAASKIAKDITATAQEAEEYYTKNKQEFLAPGQWHLREIVVDAEGQAKEILIELLKGTDFAQMAQQKSKGKTAAQGGDLGALSMFPFAQMEAAVLPLDKGAVSSVFKGPEGFYIVKVDDKTGGEQREFKDIAEEIKNGLTMMKQQQAIIKYLDDLRQKTTVYVNDKLLEGK